MQIDRKLKLNNKNNDILAFGELLVDFVSTDDDCKTEGSPHYKFFGGSIANVAINAKKLGLSTKIASAVGNDILGDFLINHLISQGLSDEFIQKVKSSTSMVIVNKSDSTPTPIFYRVADYQMSFSKNLDKAVGDSKFIHFSCWPVTRKQSFETLLKLLKTAKNNNVLVSMDPNYHHMLSDDMESDCLKRVKSIISEVDIIKPSEDDSERIFGKDTHENQISKFLELGAKLVMLTLGKDGVIVSNGTETFHYETLATEIVNTTGAGDAFWAGFYAAVVRGYTVRDAVNFGNATSAFKLKSLSSVAKLPSLDKLSEMYKLNI